MELNPASFAPWLYGASRSAENGQGEARVGHEEPGVRREVGFWWGGIRVGR